VSEENILSLSDERDENQASSAQNAREESPENRAKERQFRMMLK